MPLLVPIEPVDYLVIGHITEDITSEGMALGGTASYAALTAKAMGLRVGIVTSCRAEIDLQPLNGIITICQPAEHSTTFENIKTRQGRRQIVHHLATALDWANVPTVWQSAKIIHVGPIVHEVSTILPASFSPQFVGFTPQGWLRQWDEQGRVSSRSWENAEKELSAAGATVVSIEDVGHDESMIEDMALHSRILVVTEGAAGARAYWNGDLRRFRTPEVEEVDATGAGDIFAAAFFIRLYTTRDPWEATRFAARVAAKSVTRSGLLGIPTPEEIQACLVEVI